MFLITGATGVPIFSSKDRKTRLDLKVVLY